MVTPVSTIPEITEMSKSVDVVESKIIDSGLSKQANTTDIPIPQPQSNISAPHTPTESMVIRPSSSCPDENNTLHDSGRTKMTEPERIVEWSSSQRYGKLNSILGKGAYKIVWKAIDKEEGIEVAWNSLPSTKSEFSEFSQEIEILKKVRHPNIINLHDYWYSEGEFVFITELMTSGTLREYIQKFQHPSLKIIKRWSRQILKGLQYLHSLSPPIIHRDIKCDNIFVNGAHGEIKIGDMGTAKMKHGKKYTLIGMNLDRTDDFVGTPEFMAPEMYEEKGYNEKVDIYAFGMCLLEMVTGEYPYAECKNAAQVYKKVTNGIKPDCISKIEDKDILAIINGCISGEQERWSAKRLLEHAFFSEEPDLSVLSVDETRTKLSLQLNFRGADKQTIKFDFNTTTDTAERVVREMIAEELLSQKLQGYVTNELLRVVREITKFSNQYSSQPTANDPALPVEQAIETVKRASSAELADSPLQNAQNPISPNSTLYAAVVNGQKKIPTDIKFEPFTKDYPDQCTVEEFVLDVAIHCNRSAEKAAEWIRRLKAQDIDTVGDLHRLQEDDWIKLNLTVFATRALRNALAGRQVAAAMTSPRTNAPVEQQTDH